MRLAETLQPHTAYSPWGGQLTWNGFNAVNAASFEVKLINTTGTTTGPYGLIFKNEHR